MKFNRFFYLIKEGFKGVFSHGIRSVASVTDIAACLIIMGCFGLLAVNVDSIIADMEKESEVLAFVDENLSDADARSIESAIRSLSNIRDVEFISRDQAMENYKSQYEDSELFKDIDSSVFRNRYVIYLDDLTLMSYTVQSLRSINGIADVNAFDEIANGFITVRNIVSIIAAILIVILLVVSLFIMANTIKLATYTRREEIAIMKMVGAGNGFIRFPFVVEGLILGFFGSAIGFVLVWSIYNLIGQKVMATMSGNLFAILPFSAVMVPVLIIYLAVGMLVGAFGGALAIRNYLKV